jgi:septation ring formation regulator EzrA
VEKLLASSSSAVAVVDPKLGTMDSNGSMIDWFKKINTTKNYINLFEENAMIKQRAITLSCTMNTIPNLVIEIQQHITPQIGYGVRDAPPTVHDL